MELILKIGDEAIITSILPCISLQISEELECFFPAVDMGSGERGVGKNCKAGSCVLTIAWEWRDIELILPTLRIKPAFDNI